MTRAIHFRSKRLGDLYETAVKQGFTGIPTGKTHAKVICPCCGEAVIMSGTQADNGTRRYENVETRLRRHGLKVQGKPSSEGCRKVADETIATVFVVMRPRSYEYRLEGVAATLDKAKALLLEGVQNERSFPLSDGWWVESEKQGERERFGLNSGYLSLYDYTYVDTGWTIECREVER